MWKSRSAHEPALRAVKRRDGWTEDHDELETRNAEEEPPADLVLRFEKQPDGTYMMVATGEWMGVHAGDSIEDLLDAAKLVLPEVRALQG